MNAQKAQRTRLATSAVRLDISQEIARTHLLRVLVVQVDTPVVAPRSATSAVSKDTLPATAQRLVVTVADTRTRVTVVVAMADVPKVVRLATLAEVTATCLVTALKAKSATTVARSVTCPATAHQRLPASALATSASSQVTSRLSAPTKFAFPTMIH